MAANTPKPNRSSRTRANQKLVDGFNKHQALLTQLVIDGEVLTVAQIVARIEEIIATSNRAVEAYAAWLAAAQADLASRKANGPFLGKARAALLVAFSSHIDVLADFDLSERPDAQRSANAQPRSVSRMALSVAAMAASRQPPLLCSALSSEPRAERSPDRAWAMKG